jgi:hypothetical protein
MCLSIAPGSAMDALGVGRESPAKGGFSFVRAARSIERRERTSRRDPGSRAVRSEICGCSDKPESVPPRALQTRAAPVGRRMRIANLARAT